MKKRKLLAEICRKYNIKLVYLFGSQKDAAFQIINGNPVEIKDRLADIDVGIVFRQPLPEAKQRLELYADIYGEMLDLFDFYNLDLVFLEENHSVFQTEAVKGICVYFSSEKEKDEYENMVLKRAADFLPFLEKYYEELLEEI